MILYRGFSNRHELNAVLENLTAGGLHSLCSLSLPFPQILLSDGSPLSHTGARITFNDLDMDSAVAFMKYQKASGDENFPSPEALYQLKPLIEYTENKFTAEKHGKLCGILKIEIDSAFTHTTPGNSAEQGVFCIANANIKVIEQYEI